MLCNRLSAELIFSPTLTISMNMWTAVRASENVVLFCKWNLQLKLWHNFRCLQGIFKDILVSGNRDVIEDAVRWYIECSKTGISFLLKSCFIKTTLWEGASWQKPIGVVTDFVFSIELVIFWWWLISVILNNLHLTTAKPPLCYMCLVQHFFRVKWKDSMFYFLWYGLFNQQFLSMFVKKVWKVSMSFITYVLWHRTEWYPQDRFSQNFVFGIFVKFVCSFSFWLKSSKNNEDCTCSWSIAMIVLHIWDLFPVMYKLRLHKQLSIEHGHQGLAAAINATGYNVLIMTSCKSVAYIWVNLTVYVQGQIWEANTTKSCFFYFNQLISQQVIGRLAEGHWTQPTILFGQHNKTTHNATWYPSRLSTCQTSTLKSKRAKSIINFIPYAHDIISVHPYTNFHMFCRLYMQPQRHTACTRYYVEQILLYH